MQKSLPTLSCVLFLSAFHPFCVSAPSSAVTPVVEMEPYVVKGDRILPTPEEWYYVRVPALVLERGQGTVIVPGYEILSSRGRKNTLVFVDELQLRQLAGALLFPQIVEMLPRSPIVLLLDDRNKLQELPKKPVAKAWEGDFAFTSRALRNADEERDSRYSVGTQMIISTDDVLQSPSRYNDNAIRMGMDEEPAYDGPADRPRPGEAARQDNQRYLARAAANGGPLTIYLHGTTLRDNMPFTAEWLAREAWVSLNGYALHRLTKNAPPWLHLGLAELYGMVMVNSRFIDFGHPTFGIGSRAGLVEVFSAKKRADLLGVAGGWGMSAKFVHYCLFGDNGKHAGGFFKFIERLETEPFSAQLLICAK